MKRLVRRAIGSLASSPFFERLAMRRLRGCATIGYYHFAGPDTPWLDLRDMSYTLERFDRDLAGLTRRFEVVSLEKVLALNAAGTEALEPPLMALTFDDGLDLVRSGAAEVLSQHGISATAFVITSCVGNATLMWRHKLGAILAEAGEDRALASFAQLASARGVHAASSGAELLTLSLAWPPEKKEEFTDHLWEACAMRPLRDFLEAEQPYFSWHGLAEWQAEGHAVGLHTRTHPDCSTLSAELLEDEIAGGANDLRKALGLADVPFSYPFGRRADPAAGRGLVARGVISCALGIRGCSPWGTPAHAIERANLERGAHFELYGRALLPAWLS